MGISRLAISLLSKKEKRSHAVKGLTFKSYHSVDLHSINVRKNFNSERICCLFHLHHFCKSMWNCVGSEAHVYGL